MSTGQGSHRDEQSLEGELRQDVGDVAGPQARTAAMPSGSVPSSGSATSAAAAGSATPPAEGLRERKKRQMRQLISDTATEMFLERGFDEVRVTEVAERCGVSEKTVYNYFPTKESLVLDWEDDLAGTIRDALRSDKPVRSPTQAALEVLARELDQLGANWAAYTRSEGLLERFMNMIEETPSLRAAQRDMMDRLVQVAAEALADRAGVSPDDPEPQIAAASILGLWRIQYQALRLYATGQRSFAEIRQEVGAEVARAARLVDSGLWAFEVMVQGRGTREQLRVAADAAQEAGRQVAAALRQARGVWRQVQAQYVDARPRPGASADWTPLARPGAALFEDVQARHYRHAQHHAMRREMEEWKQVQREMKETYLKAKREQQRMLRDALRGRPEGQRRGRDR